MLLRTIRKKSPMRRGLQTAVIACALAAIPAASATAAGTTTLEFGGSGYKSLTKQKVKLSATPPATLKRNTLTLPVGGGLVGDTAVLAVRGSIRLKHGKRKLTIKAIRVSLGKRVTLSGRVGNRTMTLLTLKAAPSELVINKGGGAVRLGKSRMHLTAAAAKTIRKKLRLRRSLGTNFGSIHADAVITDAVSGVPRGSEPPVFARPATAIDITSATVDWHVRDSFVCYLATGEGASAIAPAVALAAAAPSCNDNGSHVFDFRLPLRAGGWYDPVSGTADVLADGGVRFHYSAHGIDIAATAPEVEINGAASRAIFRFGGSSRGVLMNLNLAPAGPTPCSLAGSVWSCSYPGITGSVPAGTVSDVFAGFYAAGAEFGWMTVSFMASV